MPMSAAQIERLAELAILVSTEAPLRLKPPGRQCYITHDAVRAIHKVLDEAKVDWRLFHKNARVTT